MQKRQLPDAELLIPSRRCLVFYRLKKQVFYIPANFLPSQETGFLYPGKLLSSQETGFLHTGKRFFSFAGKYFRVQQRFLKIPKRTAPARNSHRQAFLALLYWSPYPVIYLRER